MAETNEEKIVENSEQNENEVKFEEMEQAAEYGATDFAKGAAVGVAVGSLVLLT